MTEPYQDASEVPVLSNPLPRIRLVGLDRPWAWLAAGWRDILRAPHISVAYGTLAVALSFILLAGLGWLDLVYLIVPMAAGFMLVGPLLAAGLYEVSRRHERAETATLESSLTAYTRNASQVIAVGFILMLALLAWIRIAMLIFALFFYDVPPSLETPQFIARVFFSEDTFFFLFTGTAVGFILAVIVFSISVVSIPMLVDRPVGVITAVITSIAAFQQNFRTMLVWGGLIVLFTAAGIALAFLGMVLAFPLIGHATWHAYRDLVVQDDVPDEAGASGSAQTMGETMES